MLNLSYKKFSAKKNAFFKNFETSINFALLEYHCLHMFIWSYRIRCWNSCPIPQGIQMEICPWLFGIFDRFFESWLDCPRCVGQWSCRAPWLWEICHWKHLSIWSDFVYWESFHSLDIRCVNFSIVKQLAICKQWYSNNAKFMSVLRKNLKNSLLMSNKYL